MTEWDANWVNDPDHDFDLILEILHNDEDIAVISRSEQGLEITWYPHQKELVVPLDWLLERLEAAKKGL